MAEKLVIDSGRFAILAFVIAFIGLGAHTIYSQEDAEVFWVQPVPTIEELTDGKLHVGDVISAENVELVREYLPESMHRNTTDGAIWTINPTTLTSKLLIPDMIKATNENRGKAKVSADGTVTTIDGKPWIGGFPVPEPKTAMEVMASRSYYFVDSGLDEWDNYWVNPKGEVYKTIIGQVGLYYMHGRVCEEPKPVVPGMEDELRREIVLDLDPYDVRGLSVLSVLYNDQSKYPDAWGYIPVLRRVQRFSSAQRYDSIDGSDLRAGDLGAFADPYGLWDFKLLDRKPMLSLVTVNNPIPEPRKDIPLIKGKYPRDAKVELRDTYVIEAIPKDKWHIYSRKVLYIDVGLFHAWLGNFYDKQGNLWIGWHTHFVRDDSPCGNWARPTLYRLYNFQTGSGTFFNLYRFDYSPGPSVLPPETFTLKHIMSQGR